MTELITGLVYLATFLMILCFWLLWRDDDAPGGQAEEPTEEISSF